MPIRKAVPADLPDIQRLYKYLFADMAALQPDYIRAASQDEAFILSVIREEPSDILLACEEGKTLGFALVQLQRTPPYTCMVPHTYAYLTDLAVEPAARGRGLGRALLDAVKGWGRERGADYVELQVLRQNHGALRLYEREGFRDEMHTLRCPL